ncbi:hypothetical protein B0T17DRAFT_615967 [Bombardia bombarda]|uniref:DUF3669 domain-containing protein n=1 Tax=Bombardia bombarda TaxID=252184 RepID=A0AA39XAD5_9PEZI|nr:hypothetical protein B0T17DRAFT_615967 [Bombardia bombarda]
MEDIMPLLLQVCRQTLIDKYCPANLRTSAAETLANQDCLMLDLELPVVIYAKTIAEALATIYWSASMYLGSQFEELERSSQAACGFWDFNLCSRFDEAMLLEQPDAIIAQLVLAFFENDPYYPLPMMELDLEKKLWSIFSGGYIHKADRILVGSTNYEKLRELLTKFLNACVERERKNLRAGKRYGHRDFKS